MTHRMAERDSAGVLTSFPSPLLLRVTNITTSGFDPAQFESPGEDSKTSASQVTHLAISPGSCNIGGDRLEAGSLAVSSFQSRLIAGSSWQTLAFSNTFTNAATLLLELQGSANAALRPGTAPSHWLTAVARNITGTSADIALERSETTAGNPVVFVDGTPPAHSGLVFDPAQDLEFSSDNGTR